MNAQVLFNFMTTKELSSVFLMSADYGWLKKNVFHDTEFYIGMRFEFEGSTYTVKEFRTIFLDGGPYLWSDLDNECYRGGPQESNMHIYFLCEKE
jgi:hypothetical protein